MAPAGGGTQTSVDGSFSLSKEFFILSNRVASVTLTITNDSPASGTFSVSKLKHVEYTASGPVFDTVTPLYWLDIGAPGATQVDTYVVTIPAGGTANVELADADGSTLNALDRHPRGVAPRARRAPGQPQLLATPARTLEGHDVLLLQVPRSGARPHRRPRGHRHRQLGDGRRPPARRRQRPQRLHQEVGVVQSRWADAGDSRECRH